MGLVLSAQGQVGVAPTYRLSQVASAPVALSLTALILYHTFGQKSIGNITQSFKQIFVQSDELCKKRAAPGVSGAAIERGRTFMRPREKI